MNEVKFYGALLVVLLGAAYWSYNREEAPASAASEKVTILDVPKETVKSVTLFTKTQTVAMGMKTDEKGKEYPWFTVEQNKKTRGFVGNEKTSQMIESFAPFKALRSLGKLAGKELEETKLDKPERKLLLGLKSGDKEFDVGGRTTGARDHYVRARGGSEVFLVGSSILGDLEFPEGRFMQRKLREEALKDVGKVMIASNGKTKNIFHKNRLSPTDSFWSSEAKPEEKSETLGNYIDKLDKLSATEYSTDDNKFPREGTPVLIATWYGEDEAKELGSTEIWKAGEDKKTEYYAISNTTRVPVKLSKFSAEQLERDLATVMAE